MCVCVHYRRKVTSERAVRADDGIRYDTERVERRVTAHSSLQLCFFSFSFLASRKAKVSLECLSKSLTIGQHNLARSRGKSPITDLRWKSRARSSNFEKNLLSRLLELKTDGI